jgi:hypothetical protein
MIKIGHTETCFIIYVDPKDLPAETYAQTYDLHKLSRLDDGRVVVTIFPSPQGARWGIDTSNRQRLQFRRRSLQRGVKIPYFGATVVADTIMAPDGTVTFTVRPDLRHVKMRSGQGARNRRQPVPRESSPVQIASPVPAPASSLAPLREVIRMLNAHKDQLGDELVLEVMRNGKVRALVSYI